jgi:hypothetical protein
MRHFQFGLAAPLLVLVLGDCTGRVRAVPVAKDKYTFLRLKDKANQKLKDNFHTTIEGNNLADLPRGVQKFAGVKFFIGENLIQLGSSQFPNLPQKVEGIPVGQTFTRLHILHATGYYEADGTVIGAYTVRYADKTKATIEIVYGKNVRNWWATQDQKDIKDGKVAWEGTNAATKSRGAKIRLFLTTWKNPHPKKKVLTIDYTSAKTKASPFCVAMTVENK